MKFHENVLASQAKSNSKAKPIDNFISYQSVYLSLDEFLVEQKSSFTLNFINIHMPDFSENFSIKLRMTALQKITFRVRGPLLDPFLFHNKVSFYKISYKKSPLKLFVI